MFFLCFWGKYFPPLCNFPNFAKIDSEIDTRKFDSLYDFFLYYIRPIWASPWAGLGFLILAQPSLSRKIHAELPTPMSVNGVLAMSIYEGHSDGKLQRCVTAFASSCRGEPLHIIITSNSRPGVSQKTCFFNGAKIFTAKISVKPPATNSSWGQANLQGKRWKRHWRRPPSTEIAWILFGSSKSGGIFGNNEKQPYMLTGTGDRGGGEGPRILNWGVGFRPQPGGV